MASGASLVWERLGRLRVCDLCISGMLVTFGIAGLIRPDSWRWWAWIEIGIGLTMPISALLLSRPPKWLLGTTRPGFKGFYFAPVSPTNILMTGAAVFGW